MTSSLIIDASFTFRLLLPGPHQRRCQELMLQWNKEGLTLVAPSLWLYEITSALTKAVHFMALTAEEGQKALQLAQKLNLLLVGPDDRQSQLAFAWTLRLCRVAAYDSFYLALAETLPAELWTADKRFYNAVATPWIHFIEN